MIFVKEKIGYRTIAYMWIKYLFVEQRKDRMRKIKKRLLLIFTFIFVLSFSACQKEEMIIKNNKELLNNLNKVENGNLVQLKDIVNFEWDEIWSLNNYANQDENGKFKYSKLLVNTDGIPTWHLMFFKSGNLIAYLNGVDNSDLEFVNSKFTLSDIDRITRNQYREVKLHEKNGIKVFTIE